MPSVTTRAAESPGAPDQGWDPGPRGAAGSAAPALAATHLGKPSHVVTNNLGVRALELLDDLEALVKLGEDIHHRAREERMLRCLLELGGVRGRVSRRQAGEILALLGTYWVWRDKPSSTPQAAQ